MSEIVSKKGVKEKSEANFVNDIVHQNVLQIRQDLIDKHWLGELRLHDEIDGTTRKPPTKRSKADWDIFHYKLAEVINHELGQGAWTPYVGLPLPESPHTRARFSQETSIEEGRWRELEEKRQPYTVNEMLAIAYVGNVDVAHMLTPTLNVLMLETEFKPRHPFLNNTSIVDWMLWISNFRQLPEKESKDYLSNTAIPTIYRGGVNGKFKRDTDADYELKFRTRSKMSSHSGLTNRDPDPKGVAPDRKKFIPGGRMPWVPKTDTNKTDAIQRVLFLRTRLRAIFNLTRARGTEIALIERFERRNEYLGRDLRELLGLFRSD